MNWCFAIINGRLTELYFERKNGNVTFIGHTYVKEKEYTTQKEKHRIASDTNIHRFMYRGGKYKSDILPA